MAGIRQGMSAYRGTGTEAFRPYFLTLQAEAYGKIGQAEDGLAALAKALGFVGKSGERLYEAEIYRLKGALLFAQSSDNHTEAEICFHQALDIARHQQAKSLELRAATSLARLWQQQGKHQEARELLAPVYECLPRGLDTADLKEAKGLLDALS